MNYSWSLKFSQKVCRVKSIFHMLEIFSYKHSVTRKANKFLHYSFYYPLATIKWWYFIRTKTKQKSTPHMLAPQFESAEEIKAKFSPTIWNVILWEQIIRLNFALAGNLSFNELIFMEAIHILQVSKSPK